MFSHSIDEVNATWDQQAREMLEELRFEADFIKPFAFAPAFYIARRLGLAHRLATPRTAADLAGSVNLTTAGARSLLRLLARMGLVEETGGAYQTTALGQRVLDPSRGVEFIEPAYRFLELVVACLHEVVQGELSQGWPAVLDWPPSTAKASANFEPLMTATAGYVAAWLDTHVDWTSVDRLLDVGGGDGTIAALLCAKYPALRAVVFNLPSATALITETAQRHGVVERVSAVAGDFRTDVLPAGFDLVLFSRLLSDWDDATVRHLLTAARQSLAPGGRIVAVESDVPDEGTAAAPDDDPWGLFWELFVPGLNLHGPRTSAAWQELATATGLRYRKVGVCGRLPFPKLTIIEFRPDREG